MTVQWPTAEYEVTRMGRRRVHQRFPNGRSARGYWLRLTISDAGRQHSESCGFAVEDETYGGWYVVDDHGDVKLSIGDGRRVGKTLADACWMLAQKLKEAAA